MQNVSIFWEMLTTSRTSSKSSQKFFYVQVFHGHRNNICACVCVRVRKTERVGVCCVRGLCESMFCECARICVRVCVFPPVPEGGCWITGPFWQAGTLRAVSPLARPGMSSEKKRGRGSDRERERGKKGARERDRGLGGGLHVFRLIGGQRSASPPARTDSWNLWAVSTALPLKDFLSDHVYKRGRGSQ